MDDAISQFACEVFVPCWYCLQLCPIPHSGFIVTNNIIKALCCMSRWYDSLNQC